MSVYLDRKPRTLTAALSDATAKAIQELRWCHKRKLRQRRTKERASQWLRSQAS